MQYRPIELLRVAAPLKGYFQRFIYAGLFIFCFGLMLIGKVDAVLVDHLRAKMLDLSLPVLSALSSPTATLSRRWGELVSLTNIKDDNARLIMDNANLKQWLNVARNLKEENQSLKLLLNTVGERKQEFKTARVIAGGLGAFSNSLIINGGALYGIKNGQAVLNDKGLVGRIIGAGERSARILLITDINSRVPVVIEPTRTRAIMAGNNTNQPRLIHLPPGAQISVTERVVTSGHGGVFPPGIPVGIITRADNRQVRIKPFVSFHKVEFVRIVDFGMKGVVKRNHTVKKAENFSSVPR